MNFYNSGPQDLQAKESFIWVDKQDHQPLALKQNSRFNLSGLISVNPFKETIFRISS